MFPMFVRIPFPLSAWVKVLIEVAGYGAGIVLLLTVPYTDGRSFDLACSDIYYFGVGKHGFWGLFSVFVYTP